MDRSHPNLADDIDVLLDVLPAGVAEALRRHADLASLLEVVLDLGRRPEARFPDDALWIGDRPIDREDLQSITSRLGPFTSDNRAGIERTLHRISALRNRAGDVVGLTCRIGRAVHGTIDIIRDVIESGRSTLLLGPPGVGKTTLLREAARVLADHCGRRVVVVDTSNEIAGDGDVPHPGIGRARRMQVPAPERQHATMIEAVENHMPEVVVIDEIGTEAESLAARTIAERGVQLVATAHGHSLENLLSNPTLADLLGGIQAVTLGDEEARRRRTQKTVLERKLPPTFDVLVEIQARDRLAVHHEVAHVVDEFLRGSLPAPEIRTRTEGGEVRIETPPGVAEPAAREGSPSRRGSTRIFPYAVSEERLERALHQLGVPATIVDSPRDADLIVTLRSYSRKQPPKLRDAMKRELPVHFLRSNGLAHIQAFAAGLLREASDGSIPSRRDVGLEEAETAVGRLRVGSGAIELTPQPSGIRREQHDIAERAGFSSSSRGREPYRRVVIDAGTT